MSRVGHTPMKNDTLIPLQLTPTHLVCLSLKRKGVAVYTVDLDQLKCNCASARFGNPFCKHLRAANATPPLPAERLGDFLPL